MTEGVDFDHALNICLDRLRAGERLEDCLARYPSYAERLAPLLRIATTLQTPDGPDISPQGLDAGEARLLARAAQLRPQRRSQLSLDRRSSVAGLLTGARRLFVATLAGVLLLCVLLSAGTVSAASASLPGSPLYPVKRATEELVSSVAPTPQLQVRAHLTWADRRLREIETLVARGDVIDDSLLEALELETSLALGVAEQSGVELLTTAVVHTEHQQAVLGRVLKTAPAAARPGLERALNASAQGHTRAKSALENAANHAPPITPPGQTHDKKPSHEKQQTPSAVDNPGKPSPPSEAGDDVQKPGKGQSQSHTDNVDKPGQSPGKGQDQQQDQATHSRPGQGQGQDKAGDFNDSQGHGYGQDNDEPGPPDKDKDKEQDVGPNPDNNPGQGQGGGKPDKPDEPGKGKDKSK